ncbi:MAG: hypothetical protein JWO25_414 [Alphaproteobacteria bacterium]|nr:hypothetical protein [Alphaproteobacteria bacterium]
MINPPTEAETDRRVAAAVAELRRQAEQSGCTTDVDDDGPWAQFAGSFDLRQLVEAVLEGASYVGNSTNEAERDG